MQRIHPQIAKSFFLLCFMTLVVIGWASAQQATADTAKSQEEQVARAISDLRAGKVLLYQVQQLADAHAVEAIPDLEKAFSAKGETLDKAVIASVLISLGSKKEEYWNFLANLMDEVLNNGAPSPVDFDENGQPIPGPSPAFIDWAKLHGLSPGDAAYEAVYIQPGFFLRSALSGDRRAIPYLRRALASPNSSLQMFGAQGLAQFHDKESIPIIIGRCKELPAEIAGNVATALFYFDDPDAQKAFDLLVPKDEAKVMRENQRPEDGPFPPKRKQQSK